MGKKRKHNEILTSPIEPLPTKKIKLENSNIEEEFSYEGWFKIDPIVDIKKLNDEEKLLIELRKPKIKEYFEKEYVRCKFLNQ